MKPALEIIRVRIRGAGFVALLEDLFELAFLGEARDRRQAKSVDRLTDYLLLLGVLLLVRGRLAEIVARRDQRAGDPKDQDREDESLKDSLENVRVH
jgi:hypothetical protein